MRPRNELKTIADRLTSKPTAQDLKAAQQALNDLLDDRSKLAYKILRLTKELEEIAKRTNIPQRTQGWLSRFLFGQKN